VRGRNPGIDLDKAQLKKPQVWSISGELLWNIRRVFKARILPTGPVENFPRFSTGYRENERLPDKGFQRFPQKNLLRLLRLKYLLSFYLSIRKNVSYGGCDNEAFL
jgi:hypothetical protein